MAETRLLERLTASDLFMLLWDDHGWPNQIADRRAWPTRAGRCAGRERPGRRGGKSSPRLLELFPVVPVVGNLTLVVAVLSYAGQLNLTAVADADGCPDLEAFAGGVRSALDNLARSTWPVWAAGMASSDLP